MSKVSVFASKIFTTNNLLWSIYLFLLAVLLPHTSWAFALFEPKNSGESSWIPAAAAVAFEITTAVLTHKLADRFGKVPNGLTWAGRFQYNYLNEYSFGIFLAWFVSTLANLSHAVEFAPDTMRIIEQWNLPPALFAVAFGGILPTMALAFARILSNAIEEHHVEQNTLSVRTKKGSVKKVVVPKDKPSQKQPTVENTSIPNTNGANNKNGGVEGLTKKEQLISFIQNNPNQSVSEISRQTGISKSYISGVLKSLA